MAEIYSLNQIGWEMDFDFFVIGGGSGGIRAARTAAQLGVRVAVAEHGPLGGTCVNLGCIPKKLLVYASHFNEVFRHAGSFGWHPGEPKFDWVRLIENKNVEIQRLNDIYAGLLSDSGVTLYTSRARVTGSNEVTLDTGNVFSARYILIATGGEPTRPPIPGAEYGIVSDDVFFLDRLPERVLIVGGGYIGVEFAGIFHGLGVDTRLVHRGDMLLRGFDDDCRHFLAEQMQLQGIDLHFNAEVSAIERGEKLEVTFTDDEHATVDCVLFATGRQPNTETLGLTELGVELTANGAILVDQQYSTAVHSIYAVGDVIDRFMLTPMALAEGALVAQNLFGTVTSRPDYDLVPTCVFSQPNLASAGLTEEAASERGMDVAVYCSNFRPLQYSLTDSPLRALIKLIVDQETGRVVGAYMVGPEAGEIMQGLAISMRAGATKTDFDQTLGIHPTLAEEFVTLREPARK